MAASRFAQLSRHPAQWCGDPGGGMAEPRLKAGLWVRMALRMADRDGRPGVVLRKGDADSGGVLVVLRGREGLAVLSQVRTAEGVAAWMRGTGAAPVDQVAVDAYVARQVRFDPDIWVLEFDAPDLVPPFEAKLV
jgi:hypothetical protein